MDPPQNFIEHINDIAFKFLWSNKKDKIKRDTIISNYEDGGLKMLDIESFIKAQKVMWVKRLSTGEKASWKAVPYFYYDWLLGPDTWKCNLSCKIQQKHFSDFYWEILKCWCQIKELTTSQKTVIEIRRECLWFNKNIKVNKKEVRWKSWHEKGINMIHDIMDNKGIFLSVTDIINKYNVKCDILKYNALKDAIPIEWRKLVKTITVDEDTISFQESMYIKICKIDKPLYTIKNNEIYWIFVKNKQIKPIILYSLGNFFNIPDDHWADIFNISKCVRNTKI
jgi:hypothetical protein